MQFFIELLDFHIQKDKLIFKNAMIVEILWVKIVEITEKKIDSANNNACSYTQYYCYSIICFYKIRR